MESKKKAKVNTNKKTIIKYKIFLLINGYSLTTVSRSSVIPIPIFADTDNALSGSISNRVNNCSLQII